MRRYLLWLLAMILPTAAFADGDVDSLLSAIQQRLQAMGSYHVAYTLIIDSATPITGEYFVSGSTLYLHTEGMEVYGAEGVRREVNHAKREVVVDRFESLSTDFITNPSEAFSHFAKDFESELVTSGDKRIIRLTPKAGKKSKDRVEMYLDTNDMPCELKYGMEGMSLCIVISKIEPFAGRVPMFDAKAYPDFEVIDFR